MLNVWLASVVCRLLILLIPARGAYDLPGELEIATVGHVCIIEFDHLRTTHDSSHFPPA